MQGIIAVDTTLVIGESVHEVVTTIGEAIIIVIIVIFLFLQDWRATIIPAVTIPVSLIGTFAFIKIFGFSINSLTLFGITLATGSSSTTPSSSSRTCSATSPAPQSSPNAPS